MEDLESIWDIQGADEAKAYSKEKDFGLFERREYSGPSDVRGITTVTGGDKSAKQYEKIREEAEALAKRLSEEHKEKLETEMRERVEAFSQMAAEAILEGLGDGEEMAPLRKILQEMWKANVFAWQAVQDGLIDPVAISNSMRRAKDGQGYPGAPAGSSAPPHGPIVRGVDRGTSEDGAGVVTGKVDAENGRFVATDVVSEVRKFHGEAAAQEVREMFKESEGECAEDSGEAVEIKQGGPDQESPGEPPLGEHE
jgi:hypothetical protein